MQTDGRFMNIFAADTSTRTWAEWLDGWVGDPAFILRYFSVLTPFVLRSAFVHPSLIVHWLSIDCPSIVHRYDGETMENLWRKYGLKSKDERRTIEGRTNEERRQNGNRAKAERRIKHEKQKERIISNWQNWKLKQVSINRNWKLKLETKIITLKL